MWDRSCPVAVEVPPSHEKTFESVLGPLHLQRAYSHCELCESGFSPRDRALGVQSFSLTPGVLRMTGSTAALLTFVGLLMVRETKDEGLDAL